MNVLLTGAAGFVGSHVLERLLEDTEHTIVGVDDFSNGSQNNLDEALAGADKSQFILERHSLGISPCDVSGPNLIWWLQDRPKPDVIIHLAAWGSVPRSIVAPNTVFNNNIAATYEVLEYARHTGCKRVVIASSSSVYGDNQNKIKCEPWTGNPLNPYAASKQCCESLAAAYAKCYEMYAICLRFFNVFGPRQNPSGEYAAVIPKLIDAALDGEIFTLNGDGLQSRDFTYVDNVVDAIFKAGFINFNFVDSLNIACGESHSLLQLISTIELITGKKISVEKAPSRKGDILNSCADITLAKEALGYEPLVGFEHGLQKTIEYFKSKREG